MPTLDDLAFAYYGGTAITPASTQATNLQNTPTLVSNNQAALTTAVLVRTGTTRVLTYNLFNPNTSVAFLQFFNAASVGAVTLGTTAPTDWLAVPAGGVVDGAWMYSPQYSAGLVIAATTTPNGATIVTTGIPVSLGVI